MRWKRTIRPSTDSVSYTHLDVYKRQEYLIKRVIGLPGDTIEIMDGMVYINGTAYDESKYLEMSTEISGDISYPFLVPEDSYFVMGDNRANSKAVSYTHLLSQYREDGKKWTEEELFPVKEICGGEDLGPVELILQDHRRIRVDHSETEGRLML